MGANSVVQYVSIASDGSEETDLVIYDSSAVATALGKTDTLHCRLNSIRFVSNSAAGVFTIEWDADTDVLALPLPFGGSPLEMDFREIGGLINKGSTGRTGDITLTTTGLAAGDSLTIILDVRPY